MRDYFLPGISFCNIVDSDCYLYTILFHREIGLVMCCFPFFASQETSCKFGLLGLSGSFQLLALHVGPCWPLVTSDRADAERYARVLGLQWRKRTPDLSGWGYVGGEAVHGLRAKVCDLYTEAVGRMLMAVSWESVRVLGASSICYMRQLPD